MFKNNASSKGEVYQPQAKAYLRQRYLKQIANRFFRNTTATKRQARFRLRNWKLKKKQHLCHCDCENTRIKGL